jgi:hypothetical protein
MAVAWELPARAARPLLDRHQWDSYFALFAQDSAVPWKPSTVRLDTFSGAPVDFAAYAVDPAEVIVAGASRSARPIDSSKLQPVVRWRFSPPAGYRFETSNVPLPLGAREGFFVIEARRGDAVQQVWLNRTRVGLLTKESPEGLAVWTVDLRTGRALRATHVEALVGSRLVEKSTDNNGLLLWRDRDRPAFVLVDSGPSRAFVSLLPQAPVPAAVVGVRVESAVVRAGGTVRVAGFARRRSGNVFRKASGDARVTLVGLGKTIATADARLDAAGAFSADLGVPSNAAAGDYALLANVGGTVGGTTVHLDSAADVSLAVAANCPCAPGSEVVLTVSATREGGGAASSIPLTVEVVRSPHIIPPGESDETPRWGTELVTTAAATTDASGHARVVLDAPTDGLDSTYGVRAYTAGNGATATTRVTVASAPVALALEADSPAVDLGQSAGFTVRGFSTVDGTPAANLEVRVRLSHGATVEEQAVRLDERGRARVVFRSPSVGTNIALAQTSDGGKTAFDAASVVVAPGVVTGTSGASAGDVALTLDRQTYRAQDRIGVSASLPGSSGDALVTLEGARTYQARVVGVSAGRAGTSLDLGDTLGDTRVAVAFVRDGAIVTAATPVQLESAGHAYATNVSLDRASYAIGDVAHVTVRDGAASGAGTVVVRLTDGSPTGSANFDDIGAVLRGGGTTSQNAAAESPAWHAWVAPARSKAGDIFAADRPRQVRSTAPALGAAAPRALYWHVERSSPAGLDVPVPRERGTYVLCVLEVYDDGSVGTGRAALDVK